MYKHLMFALVLYLTVFVCPGPAGLTSVFGNPADETGLLFYLSADYGTTADYAKGDPEPGFVHGIDIVTDGAKGPAFQCAHDQLLAYPAPGNVYAERGTLAFFWRSREPVGKIPFPVFRVSYSDHSSWDMAWLRIDYNGGGFDAFVTDLNLARVRVSVALDRKPAPGEWTHITLSWDETAGIRFYIDGKLAAARDTVAVFYSGLDQFGPHSRIISPYQVQSLYNFQRGGDIDEVRIYDRMLSGGNIASLAQGGSAGDVPPSERSLSEATVRDEWFMRYGWNRPGDIPPYLTAPATTVHKVEIHDVYDIKQWWWKANDGIRETTWPGVYNRSRLPGRTDYFIYPDWNCYSLSGKKVTFMMPEEPWNHIEIAGATFGKVSWEGFDLRNHAETPVSLFVRPSGQERTFHRIETHTGGKVTFENTEQETPIGEFSAYYVSPAREPVGTATLSYTLTARDEPDNPCLESLVDYIGGRFLPDERTIMVATRSGAPRTPKKGTIAHSLPLVHVLVPFEFRQTQNWHVYTRFSYTWENLSGGLDGIAVDLPPLDVKPTHGEYFPMNIQVRDPIWPDRAMLDFTFSVRPNEARTLWLDTRDRLLPNGPSLYLTIAGAGADFGADDLEGASIRLVFKDRDAAKTEHELDRFTQAKDNYSHLVEEHANIKTLRLYDRLNRDLTDLLTVNPDHIPGRYYWCRTNPEQGWPQFTQPESPPGTPLWAFRQIEVLKNLKRFCLWWIDNRQIENGELGGGLSDDGDHSNIWPGAALMGIEPEKLTDSTLRLMDAYYDQGLFTNGLATIMADELHSYEEGISVIPQTMLLDYADPKVVERLMETSAAYERITGINSAGHRHFRSNYFSGTDIAEQGVWLWSQPYNYLILHAGMVLVEYNGHPAVKKLLLKLADGLLAHSRKDADGNLTTTPVVNFATDEDRPGSPGTAAHLLWAAWRWTGDRKYLEPILDDGDRGEFSYFGLWQGINANLLDLLDKHDTWGKQIVSQVTPQSGSDVFRHLAWQVTGNKQFLEEYYADQFRQGSQEMYIMTEGHMWTDRVSMPISELQMSRLGGVALTRNTIYPGHVVSWKFEKPATDESVAILVQKATTREIKIIAYNLEKAPVTAIMTAWDILPGTWEVVRGIDLDGNDFIDGQPEFEKVMLERTKTLRLTFPPGKTTIVRLKLKSRTKDYWERPDLGIGDDDVKRSENTLTVTVHSLGSVDAPAATIALVGRNGNRLASVRIPALAAPLDLKPKTADVSITIPAGADITGACVVVDPGAVLQEITRLNNTVELW